MKKFIIFVLAIVLSLTACNSDNDSALPKIPTDSNENEQATITVPNSISEIPQSYYKAAKEQGTLVELRYNTYESFSYGTTNTPLNKRAIVYLPYGYTEKNKYNVMYMMHGGWSNEVGLLGTPENTTNFKNAIDNAIENRVFAPLIIVCPTYNNTNANGQDSDNYSLALQLTRNYHNELVNDLIPAVEGTYSSYAESVNKKDLIAARDHRAFMGFSMGSVTTWRTFEYCLDYFRYFFPSSGAITSDGSYMENIVQQSGYSKNDFFIYAMSGTNDFAYSQFTNQINAMLETNTFIKANNEKEGNLAYNVKEGYSHDGKAQTEYFYNALCWVWKRKYPQQNYTPDTKISDVINDPAFGNWGRMIFPINTSYWQGDTLGNLSLTWYNNINVAHTVEICNYFKNQTLLGNHVFYNIYTDEEKATDPRKEYTGLFFFRGKKNAKFAITCAGGGWAYTFHI